MSRLGDMLRKQRLESKLTPKQAAKLCGVAEGYLIDVEEGRRIIADDIASRMLRKLGVTEPVGMEQEVSSVPAAWEAARPKAAAPIKPLRAEPAPEPADAWLDALGGVLRRVPVYAADGVTQEVRLLPVTGGLIEGAPADKVFFVQIADDALTGYRIHEGDLVLCVPVASVQNGAIHAILHEGKTLLRRLTRIDGNQVHIEAQRLGQVPKLETLPLSAIKVLGRAVRCEFAL